MWPLIFFFIVFLILNYLKYPLPVIKMQDRLHQNIQRKKLYLGHVARLITDSMLYAFKTQKTA